LRLLTDENFNGDIIRGLLLRQQDLDIVRVQEVGLAGHDDPEILAWAAVNDRIPSLTIEPPCPTLPTNVSRQVTSWLAFLSLTTVFLLVGQSTKSCSWRHAQSNSSGAT
jgi:hypothetical protein